MKCNEFTTKGILYFYKELESKEMKDFEAHLKECEECRACLKELNQTVEMYNRIPEEEPSQEIVATLLEKAKRKRFAWQPAILPRKVWRPAFAGIGTLAILIVVGYLLFRTPETYMEWSNGADEKIELLSDRVYQLWEEEPSISVSVEERLEDISERIGYLKEEMEGEWLF